MTKIDPRIAAGPDEIVSLADARCLADELPEGRRTKDEAARELYRWLNDEGQLVQSIRGIRDYDAKHKARLRKGLQRIAQGNLWREGYTRLCEADADTLHQFQIAYGWEDDVKAAAARLADALDVALQLVASEVGRPGAAGPYKGAALLKDKFEEMSEYRFTRDQERGAKGVGWSTPGSRFVALGLLAWFPDITDGQRDYVIKLLKGNNNLQKPPPK